MVFGRRDKTNVLGEDGADRSSTASHFSADYDTIDAGEAEDEFYGIPLSNDFSGLTPLTIASFTVFLLLLLLKPRIKILDQPIFSVVFWLAMFYVAYLFKELALYPLVSMVILTRTAYPLLVVIPHCISSAAAYRKERSSSVHYLPAFASGFLCYGFGGSICSDLLMGLPVTALGHSRILPSYILGWFLVWFSPFDIVYKLVTDKKSFVYYFINTCEAVDCVTTPMGRVSRGARELKNKSLAPIIAGLLAGSMGATVRYADRVLIRGEGKSAAEESTKSLEFVVWRTLGYALLWWYIAVYKCYTDEYNDAEKYHCPEYNGRNLHRFVIVASHVLWTLASDFGLATGHPFVFLSRKLREFGSQVAATLHYGPQQALVQVKTEKIE